MASPFPVTVRSPRPVSDSTGPCERDADAGRIAAGTNGEIVLEPAGVGVEGEIDSRIEIGVAHAGIGRDVRPPVAGIGAEEVVRDVGLGISGYRRDGSRSGEGHDNGVSGASNGNRSGVQENRLTATVTAVSADP
jgi:hypothetical protein